MFVCYFWLHVRVQLAVVSRLHLHDLITLATPPPPHHHHHHYHHHITTPDINYCMCVSVNNRVSTSKLGHKSIMMTFKTFHAKAELLI